MRRSATRQLRGHLLQKACGSFVLFLLSSIDGLPGHLPPPNPQWLAPRDLFSQLAPRRRRLILDGLVVSYALSSFQRTKAPPTSSSGHPGFPATFAFASVTPFRGTLQAYDGCLNRVNLFFGAPTVLVETGGVEGQGGFQAVYLPACSAGASSNALDRRHRVKRISDITIPG